MGDLTHDASPPRQPATSSARDVQRVERDEARQVARSNHLAALAQAARERGARTLKIVCQVTVWVDERQAHLLAGQSVHQDAHGVRLAGARVAADRDASGALV